MIIKVCGMRDADNIREVTKLGIDMMGFDFHKDSPRYVYMISSQAGIIPDYSKERLKKVTGKDNSQSSADQIAQPRTRCGSRPMRVSTVRSCHQMFGSRF